MLQHSPQLHALQKARPSTPKGGARKGFGGGGSGTGSKAAKGAWALLKAKVKAGDFSKKNRRRSVLGGAIAANDPHTASGGGAATGGKGKGGFLAAVLASKANKGGGGQPDGERRPRTPGNGGKVWSETRHLGQGHTA